MANIIHLTNLDKKNVWKVVKNLKSELSLDLECRLSPDLLLYDDKMSQVNLLEDQLGIESTEVRFENIGRENLKTAAEIYIYLNTCPDSLKPWFSFYKDLFHDQAPNQIILTLNRMMKSKGTEVKDGNIRAAKLMEKITNKLSLHYKDIQRLAQPNHMKSVTDKHKTVSINISDNGTYIEVYK